MRIAVYPGSFDPVTNGHIDIVERAVKIFDLVYVAVIRNPEKTPQFLIEERMEMLEEAVRTIPKAKADSFDGLLINYAQSKGACAIIRGLRAVSDFDYEFQMALTNRRLNPEIETVFMMTGYKYSYLSSSLIKQIARLGGDLSGLIPLGVERKLKAK